MDLIRTKEKPKIIQMPVVFISCEYFNSIVLQFSGDHFTSFEGEETCFAL